MNNIKISAEPRINDSVVLKSAIALFMLILCFYFIMFNGELSSDNTKWGEFGDYAGGILNPIIAFTALYY